LHQSYEAEDEAHVRATRQLSTLSESNVSEIVRRNEIVVPKLFYLRICQHEVHLSYEQCCVNFFDTFFLTNQLSFSGFSHNKSLRGKVSISQFLLFLCFDICRKYYSRTRLIRQFA